MGLDERIEAKRLEAMPEIVIEDTVVISDPQNNLKYFGVGTVIPAGIYVGRTIASMEVLSGTVNASSTRQKCTLSNSGLAFIRLSWVSNSSSVAISSSSGNNSPGDMFIVCASTDVTLGNRSSEGAYVAVSNVQANSSYEVTGRIELRKLL